MCFFIKGTNYRFYEINFQQNIININSMKLIFDN